MARYFKCDVCDKLFDIEDNNIVSIMKSDQDVMSVLEYDLCTKCYDRIIEFTGSLKSSTIDTSKCTYDKDGYLNKI